MDQHDGSLSNDASGFSRLAGDLAASIRLGYEVEANDPGIAYEMPGHKEIEWLAAWLVSEGWTRDPQWPHDARR